MKRFFSISLLLTFLFPVALLAQGELALYLSDQLFREKQGAIRIKTNWKVTQHDSASFMQSDYDDAHWLPADDETVENGGGIYWFRTTIRIADSALFHKPLAIWLTHAGAAEVYLNGQKVVTYGTVGKTIEDEVPQTGSGFPSIIEFPVAGEQHIAVRYSSHHALEAGSSIENKGFALFLSYPSRAFTQLVTQKETQHWTELFTVTIPLLLALLHLFLYFVRPTAYFNLNLGFAALFAALCGNLFLSQVYAADPRSALFLSVLNQFSMLAVGFFILLWVHTYFEKRISLAWVIFASVVGVFTGIRLLFPMIPAGLILLLPLIASLLYGFGIIRKSVRKPKAFFLIGLIAFVSTFIFDSATSYEFIEPVFSVPITLFGLNLLLLMISAQNFLYQYSEEMKDPHIHHPL